MRHTLCYSSLFCLYLRRFSPIAQTFQTVMKNIFRKGELFAAVFAALLLLACGEPQKSKSNWMAEDDVKVGIDETFQPIMEEIVQTFGMANPEANMKPLYASEDSVIRLLVNDSLRCCIATRPLDENEKKVVQSHTLGVKQVKVATDAIALIVNKENKDSLITLSEIKAIMRGEITRWEQLKRHQRSGELKVVFDHSASSTVRFMRDSLCDGKELKGNVFASEKGTNPSVIEMVKANPNLIGIVGVDWLKPKKESALADFSGLDVNVMRVSKSDEIYAQKFVRPYQYYIATADYPLLRSLYLIETDPRSKSFVRSFYFFVKGQKGQTIICNNSQLLPLSPVQVKDVSIK